MKITVGTQDVAEAVDPPRSGVWDPERDPFRLAPDRILKRAIYRQFPDALWIYVPTPVSFGSLELPCGRRVDIRPTDSDRFAAWFRAMRDARLDPQSLEDSRFALAFVADFEFTTSIANLVTPEKNEDVARIGQLAQGCAQFARQWSSHCRMDRFDGPAGFRIVAPRSRGGATTPFRFCDPQAVRAWLDGGEAPADGFPVQDSIERKA